MKTKKRSTASKAIERKLNDIDNIGKNNTNGDVWGYLGIALCVLAVIIASVYGWNILHQ